MDVRLRSSSHSHSHSHLHCTHTRTDARMQAFLTAGKASNLARHMIGALIHDDTIVNPHLTADEIAESAPRTHSDIQLCSACPWPM